MKLPVPGFVSQAFSSLINNDRRQKRVPFDKADGYPASEPLRYKKVTKEERATLVRGILAKRRRKLIIGTLLLIMIVSLSVLFLML